MNHFCFIAKIKILPTSDSFFSERDLRAFECSLGGEHGVKKDGTLIRVAEQLSEVRKINFILDLSENKQVIHSLVNWVMLGFGSDQEYYGETLLVYSEYGKPESINVDKSFFFVGLRENSKGNPDKSYQEPICISGSYCIA